MLFFGATPKLPVTAPATVLLAPPERKNRPDVIAPGLHR